MNAPIPANRFGIGGNLPPPIEERLAADYAGLLNNAAGLAAQAAALPVEISSDDDLEPVTALVKEIAKEAKAADSHRTSEKEPFLDGGRKVDGFFRKVIDDLAALKRELEARATIYMRAKADAERRRRQEEEARRREEERAAREEAARRLREAEEADRAAREAAEKDRQKNIEANLALAAAVSAEKEAERARQETIRAQRDADARAAALARTRTSAALATMRTEWVGEVEDMATIDLEALRPHLNPADVEKAVRSFVKAGGRALPGARIFERESAVIR